MDFSVANKRVVITGATHGIGLAAAQRFAARGAKLLISGRRDSGERIAEDLDAHFVRADFNNDADIKHLFEQAERQLGRIDVLINNAGYGYDEGFNADTDLTEVDKLLQVNLKAVMLSMQLATPLLNDGAAVINTSSIAASQGSPLLSAYAASKAAINSLTQSLACELAPRSIRVNAVCPGPIQTTYWQDDDPLMPLVEHTMPLGRVGKPDEVASLMQFLASTEAKFITGQCIAIDGGMSAGSAVQLYEKLGIS